MTSSTPSICVAALYRFCPLPQFHALRSDIAAFCCARGIRGSLLIASEGLNGTVAGGREAIDELVAFLEAIPGVGVPEIKYSSAADMPFHRMKVRLKREIVTMGVADLDPPRDAGAYVEPEDWDALISDPDTIVIDTRNEYEIALGAFEGARDPGTKTFRDFPAWARENADTLAESKVAMYCTGGIRCEKATAYLRSLGVLDVHHLRGGILKYLEAVRPEESLWRGECFVFDERVSVGHGLVAGEAVLCRACRHPLTSEDRRSSAWQEGVSCARCVDIRSDRDRARYAERQRQVKLALARGLPLPIGRP